jgi:hypothetical protein
VKREGGAGLFKGERGLGEGLGYGATSVHRTAWDIAMFGSDSSRGRRRLTSGAHLSMAKMAAADTDSGARG